MVLVQKWPIFQLFFLANIGQENVFYDILDRKNAFVDCKNKKLKKLRNWHFWKRVNPWFWSKNDHFSNFLFLGNIRNGHFFYSLFLGDISQENVFYDILERKTAFLSYKIRS